MKSIEIEQFLHQNIPLTVAMGVQVIRADIDYVALSAPLAPNINHRESVFGGSASALATLAAWSLISVRLEAEGNPRKIVIQRGVLDYDKPIIDDFSATCSLSDINIWQRFMKTLRRRDIARIHLSSQLRCNGELVGRFEGSFVALEPL
jgi:thioesterase domain-containing protein